VIITQESRSGEVLHGSYKAVPQGAAPVARLMTEMLVAASGNNNDLATFSDAHDN